VRPSDKPGARSTEVIMDYELAKQLKEARFPLKGSPSCKKEHSHKGDDCEYGFYPTLSELIEACGNTWTEEGLEKPARFSLSWDKYPDSETGAWMATYFEEDGFPTGNAGYGDTPEEAVARLWLVLNKEP
jgi:hypothetical protein